MSTIDDGTSSVAAEETDETEDDEGVPALSHLISFIRLSNGPRHPAVDHQITVLLQQIIRNEEARSSPPTRLDTLPEDEEADFSLAPTPDEETPQLKEAWRLSEIFRQASVASRLSMSAVHLGGETHAPPAPGGGAPPAPGGFTPSRGAPPPASGGGGDASDAVARMNAMMAAAEAAGEVEGDRKGGSVSESSAKAAWLADRQK